jgi:hypothetical protein
MHSLIVRGDTALSALETGGAEGWHQSISLADDGYAGVSTHAGGLENQRGGSHHAVADFRARANKLGQLHRHAHEYGLLSC